MEKRKKVCPTLIRATAHSPVLSPPPILMLLTARARDARCYAIYYADPFCARCKDIHHHARHSMRSSHQSSRAAMSPVLKCRFIDAQNMPPVHPCRNMQKTGRDERACAGARLCRCRTPRHYCCRRWCYEGRGCGKCRQRMRRYGENDSRVAAIR